MFGETRINILHLLFWSALETTLTQLSPFSYAIPEMQFMRPWSSRQDLLPKLALQQYSIRGLQFLQLPIQLQDAMMILRLVNMFLLTQ